MTEEGRNNGQLKMDDRFLGNFSSFFFFGNNLVLQAPSSEGRILRLVGHNEFDCLLASKLVFYFRDLINEGGMLPGWNIVQQKDTYYWEGPDGWRVNILKRRPLTCQIISPVGSSPVPFKMQFWHSQLDAIRVADALRKKTPSTFDV